MRQKKAHILLITLLSTVLLAGCYTQVKTLHPDRVVYDDRPPLQEQTDEAKAEMREEAIERRMASLDMGEDPNYLYGYEDGHFDGYDDGWTDAESYYFIDYEARRWYRDHGAVFYRDRPVRVTHIHNYYGYPYSYWHYRPYSWHRPWYGRSGSFFAFHFGFGYHYYDPWYSWHWHDPFYSPYAFHRYPPYYGYHRYGSYWRFGFGYAHHGFRFRTEPSRTYTVRGSALSSTGQVRTQRSRGSSSAVSGSRQRDGQASETPAVQRRGETSAPSRGTVQRRGETSRTGSGTVQRRGEASPTGRSVQRSRPAPNNRAGESVRNRIEPRQSGSAAPERVRQSSTGNRSNLESRVRGATAPASRSIRAPSLQSQGSSSRSAVQRSAPAAPAPRSTVNSNRRSSGSSTPAVRSGRSSGQQSGGSSGRRSR